MESEDKTLKDMDMQQDANDVVEDTVYYLSENKYPEGCSNNRKRQIRKKAEKFLVKDDELYYTAGKDKLVRACYEQIYNLDGL